MKRLAALISTFLLGIGPVVAQPPPPPPPLPYAAVPPPRVEVVPPPRGERYIWEPGHWHWNGRQYVWISGRYVERRPSYGHYADGRWVWAPREGRWIWRPAHWE